MDYDDDYGYGGVQLSLTRASEDGNYLNPSKLYYNMYLDDEKYTFYPDEYPEKIEDLTDVPYSYSGTDLISYGDNHITAFFVKQLVHKPSHISISNYKSLFITDIFRMLHYLI